MIRVCDAIMGNGKSSAAINYINDHPDDKFIYITPYLEEAARIKAGCPKLHFVEPQQLHRYNNSKLYHTQALIAEGKNIATTHQAFKNYTEETLSAIREFEYTLVIDENVDVLETCDIHEDDIQLALDAGYISYEDGKYSLIKKDYSGDAFREMFWLLKSRQITRIDTDGADSRHLFYWVLPQDLLTSFKDVFILTYLFEGQSLHSFLEIYDLPYTRIGIEKTHRGTGYQFCDYPGYTPEYVYHIKDMIDIVDNKRLNEVGDEETALSKTWFDRCHATGVPRLKHNINNVFKNVWKDAAARERMWSTYKTSKEELKGKGYTNGFSVLNLKATNKHRMTRYLVYACNLYMNVNEKTFYYKHGITVDEDKYALSIMLQWIWRSAIRDGEKIHIYLPSRRMRRILKDWIDGLGKGGDGVGE